jgi:hypothetical protein
MTAPFAKNIAASASRARPEGRTAFWRPLQQKTEAKSRLQERLRTADIDSQRMTIHVDLSHPLALPHHLTQSPAHKTTNVPAKTDAERRLIGL